MLAHAATRYPDRTVLASLLAAAVVFAPVPARAHAAQAPGSRVVLDVPPSFIAATRFAGFADEPRGISIVLGEFPAANYDEMIKGMTPEVLTRGGFTNVKSGTLVRPGEHIYITAEQAVSGTTYAKYLLILRENGATALVTVNVPRHTLTSGAATAREVETILASTRIADTPVTERPLFTLSYLGPFKRAGALAGATTLYSLDGVMTPPTPDPNRPLFIVAPSLDDRAVGDLDAFARRALEGTQGYGDLTITGTRTLTIAGLRAVEMTAKAIRSGTPVVLVQTIVAPPSGGYVRMLGQATSMDSDRLLPEFQKMAASYTPTP